ncbi:hypothetical protein NDU88_001887, partial [Pleurodeles waltl]
MSVKPRVLCTAMSVGVKWYCRQRRRHENQNTGDKGHQVSPGVDGRAATQGVMTQRRKCGQMKSDNV